jgi:hypothetical protein
MFCCNLCYHLFFSITLFEYVDAWFKFQGLNWSFHLFSVNIYLCVCVCTCVYTHTHTLFVLPDIYNLIQICNVKNVGHVFLFSSFHNLPLKVTSAAIYNFL